MNILSFLFLILLKGFAGCQQTDHTLNLSIDWEKDINEITPYHWGVNDYEIVTPHRIADTGLQEFGQNLNPSIVRIHHALIADSLMNPNTLTWNKERIAQCFEEAQKAYPHARFMINPIAYFPHWISQGNAILDTSQEEELIEAFISFTQTVHELGIPIHSIEIFNERDNGYEEKGKLEQLWYLFNKISIAIRTQYPEIKIAGPALTWPKRIWVESFLEISGQHTDIFTWHGYFSGNPETTTPSVIGKGVNHIDSLAGYVNEAIQRHGLTNLQSSLTEYNVQWVWEPFEIRHANNIGAVYQALVVDKMAQRGLESVLVWHLKGFSYGLINDKNVVRSTGQLYLWGRHYLSGMKVGSSSSDPEIEVIAIKNSDEKSVLIINKSNCQKILSQPQKYLMDPIAKMAQITDNSMAEKILRNDVNELVLPPYSLTLFSNKN